MPTPVFATLTQPPEWLRESSTATWIWQIILYWISSGTLRPTCGNKWGGESCFRAPCVTRVCGDDIFTSGATATARPWVIFPPLIAGMGYAKVGSLSHVQYADCRDGLHKSGEAVVLTASSVEFSSQGCLVAIVASEAAKKVQNWQRSSTGPLPSCLSLWRTIYIQIRVWLEVNGYTLLCK